jgi:hypothetical protein
VDTRSGSVNGSRSDQSNVTLDGVPVNDKGSHSFTSALPVTLDSIQEFRVTTTNYGADEGVSSAAQVALVTKSGTNNFHGSVYEYNRNSYVSANDYFIKTSQLLSGSPNQPPQLNRNIFGGSLGGPIKKDRLFIFLNFEGYRDAEAVSAVRTVPTATMRDGVIQYLCLNQNTTACPGNTVTGLSGATYTAPAGYFALSPEQITKMDNGSLGPHGPDPVVLQYMKNTYPLPNDSTVGDGLNTAGYRFRAPTDTTKNWYIAKVDYNITTDAKQRLSVSGALANENNAGAPFLPGAPPEQDIVNYNKGIIAGYSAVITSSTIPLWICARERRHNRKFRSGVELSSGIRPGNHLLFFVPTPGAQPDRRCFLDSRTPYITIRVSIRVFEESGKQYKRFLQRWPGKSGLASEFRTFRPG